MRGEVRFFFPQRFRSSEKSRANKQNPAHGGDARVSLKRFERLPSSITGSRF